MLTGGHCLSPSDCFGSKADFTQLHFVSSFKYFVWNIESLCPEIGSCLHLTVCCLSSWPAHRLNPVKSSADLYQILLPGKTWLLPVLWQSLDTLLTILKICKVSRYVIIRTFPFYEAKKILKKIGCTNVWTPSNVKAAFKISSNWNYVLLLSTENHAFPI